MHERHDIALGINNLPPPLDRMRVGGLYAFVGTDNNATNALLWCMAGNAVASQQELAYVFDRDPDATLSASTPLADRLKEYIADNKVLAFSPKPLLLPGNNANLLKAELEYFGAGTGRLIIVEGADQILGDDSAKDTALEMLRHWCTSNGNTLLLAYHQRDGQSDPTLRLLPVAKHFLGMARLAHISGTLRWDVFHWFAADSGFTAAASYALTSLGDGRLQAEIKHPAASDQPQALAADEQHVIVVAHAIEKNHKAPGAWEVVGDITQLRQRTREAVAATIIIGFDRDTSLEQISRAVYELRCSRGLRLKIVIREIGTRLRYQQEALLCKLGANIVAPVEVNHARFLSLVEMVQGQLFAGQLRDSYEKAVSDAMPLDDQDYLPPAAFLESVARALLRCQALGVQSNLIRIKVVDGLAPIDAMRYCVIKRPGDICTIEKDCIWLFLFACREDDVSASLERIFRLPLSDLCEEETRYPSGDALHTALGRLGKAIAITPPPDFSDQIGRMRTEDAITTTVATASASNYPPVIATYSNAGNVAIRRSLVLKKGNSDAA